MGKKTETIGYHIEVETGFRHVRSLAANKDECERLLAQIKRHVDVGMHDALMVTERESTCEHCGYKWGEKSDTYNGGCCDEDEKNNPEATHEMV